MHFEIFVAQSETATSNILLGDQGNDQRISSNYELPCWSIDISPTSNICTSDPLNTSLLSDTTMWNQIIPQTKQSETSLISKSSQNTHCNPTSLNLTFVYSKCSNVTTSNENSSSHRETAKTKITGNPNENPSSDYRSTNSKEILSPCKNSEDEEKNPDEHKREEILSTSPHSSNMSERPSIISDNKLDDVLPGMIQSLGENLNFNLSKSERMGDEEKNFPGLCTGTDEKRRKELLPRSIKVYQLLATQSEDRGDGSSHLNDRRISLQISRPEGEDEMEEKDKTNDEGVSFPQDSKQNKFLLSADDISTKLKINNVIAGCWQSENNIQTINNNTIPLRKLSSPGDVESSQRTIHCTDTGSVTVRPIYPYCPYSPYGSPQGSPRNRRRPLRESRRVSIDNRQGGLQLNQYKLLDNIGQVSMPLLCFFHFISY